MMIMMVQNILITYEHQVRASSASKKLSEKVFPSSCGENIFSSYIEYLGHLGLVQTSNKNHTVEFSNNAVTAKTTSLAQSLFL
jgi:hypothetical protein